MPIERPRGRKTNVTSGGSGVHRRGEGLGTGPVNGGSGRPGGPTAPGGGAGPQGGGRGTGNRGGGGRNPLVLLILAAIVLLGGGGGLGSLLGGGDSGSSTGSSSGSYSGQSGSGDYTSYYQTGYGSGYDYEEGYGNGSGFDLSGLSQLFGTDTVESMTGTSTGWANEPANTGVLNTKVASEARARYTKLKGNGKDQVTVMVYMCGTDLESRSGMATNDLVEMTKATLSDNVNVIIYTGGCTKWQNNAVDNRTNQIWQIMDGKLRQLVADDGDRVMTDPKTLTRFIKWCDQNFPANRNELIFWDHGGGSITGYGYDEKHSRDGAMDLAEINSAIGNGGVKFDFIGFDACLMATAENALSLAPYADYLIASEETEPGTGWYYTNWLTALAKDPGMATTKLGKLIIDDFVDVSAKQARGQATTLSLVDLAELQETLPKVFSGFAKDTSALIQNKEYRTVANARSSARKFATSNAIDQVDLVDLAEYIGSDAGKELSDVLLSAIKYNRVCSSMTNAYGLSIYFPGGRKLSYVDTMVKTYEELGLDDDYTKCIQQYATVAASGQAVSGQSQSPYSMLGTLLGSGSSSSGSSSSSSSYGTGESLFGSDMMGQLIGQLLSGNMGDLSSLSSLAGLTSSNSSFFGRSGLDQETIEATLESNWFDASKLEWTEDEETGAHLLKLDEDQWQLVEQLDMNLFYDDGEGYVDLGLDNVYQFTEDGDLIGDTDRTWMSIDGTPVAYYHETTSEDGDAYRISGRVPCLLNGERADLILVFDNDNENGYIAGARRAYADGETETIAKADTELQEGDEIDFLCDYYTYEGDYQDSYMLGDQWSYHDDAQISNTDVGDGGALVSYRFTDLYGQNYWTDPIAE